MNTNPIEIFEQYKKGNTFKASLGNKGIFEQGKINERFFIGDQWYGAKCGNDRPLVRHNIIKRIGNYKMSQVLGSPVELLFSADGVATDNNHTEFDYNSIKPSTAEISHIMQILKQYYKTTAERVRLNELNEAVLRKAYISGTAVLYTYWEPSVKTGFFGDGVNAERLNGDICCEVLDINDIVFGDVYLDDLQSQPYIIISSYQNAEEVLREARLNGCDLSTLKDIENSAREKKVQVLLKLYKEKRADGIATVKGIKVTENAVVRKEFDTGLSLYPLSVFAWEKRNNLIYGESEITYLIPNQIAINRMITANVWSAMTTGMPIMLVNGDTVTDKITNDPGQIIKIYGSNEDVAGAVKYITPPAFSEQLENSINTLINNTLTQSGANEVALGDSRADNATALATMRDAALMPLQLIKNRFYGFCEDVARIWVDFWLNYYGNRPLKLKDGNKITYEQFKGERYKDLVISVNIEVSNSAVYSEREKTELLITMYDKGIIDRNQFLKRLPDGAVSDRRELLEQKPEVESNERI